jgi:hypothetical protein
VKVIGDVVDEAIMPPGVDVPMYPMIAAPPFEAGAVNAAVAVVDPVFVAVPIVGASGANTSAASVVMLLLEAEAFPSPTKLVAFTVNVYDVAGVNPVIVIGDVVDEATMLPGVDVTV